MDEKEKLKEISEKLNAAAYSLDAIFEDFVVIGSVKEQLSTKEITGASHMFKGNMKEMGESILLSMRNDDKIRLLLQTCVSEYEEYDKFMESEGVKNEVITRKLKIKSNGK